MVLWGFLVGAEDKQRWKGTSLFLASRCNSSLEAVVEAVGGPHAGEVQGVHPSLCGGAPAALSVCNSPEAQPKAAVSLAGEFLGLHIQHPPAPSLVPLRPSDDHTGGPSGPR